MKNLNKTSILFAISLSVSLVAGCSSGNLEETKDNAAVIFKDNGFDVVGYHGYMWGAWGFNDYGGAMVWYTIKKESNGLVYEAGLQRWGDEYHLYNLNAVDAISPN